jgi:hypothetical protein
MQTRQKPLPGKSSTSSIHLKRRFRYQQVKTKRTTRTATLKSTKFLLLIVPEPRNSPSAAAMQRIRKKITDPFSTTIIPRTSFKNADCSTSRQSELYSKFGTPPRFCISKQVHRPKNHLDKLLYTSTPLPGKPPSLFFLAKEGGWNLDNTLKMPPEHWRKWNGMGNSENQF